MFRGDHQDGHSMGRTGSPSGHVDDWEDLAVDFVDGRLDRQTAAAIEHHLEDCPACAARLHTQRGALAFLQAVPLQDPPVGLEDRVLDEVLAPPEPIRAPARQWVEKPTRWSVIWRRKIRPWIPATVGVAAVFLAVVSYGLLRPNGDEAAQYAATTSVAYTQSEAAADSAEREQTVGAVLSTAAPATTVAALGPEATTTAAGATTTAMAAVGTTAETTAAPVAAAATQDRKTMIANLEDAQTPAYFDFDATALDDEGSVEKASTSVVDQIVALTGLQPLDGTLSLGGPTFAAFVARDVATQLIDLLRSIGASVQLPVSLDMEPPDTAAETVARLMESKGDIPELLAHRTPQPAVSGWTFTTSTLPKSADGAGETGSVPPDEAGTHVLVVIYLRD